MDEHRTEAVDRISDLPEPILHHILSKVEATDAARTSVLSKAWKSIYDSFPVVVLDELFIEEYVKSYELSSEERQKYLSNLEQFRTRYNVHIRGVGADEEKGKLLAMMIIREKFMLLSNNSLKRINQQKELLSIKKFRFRIFHLDDEFASVIDNWVGLVTERNIEELDIDLGCTFLPVCDYPKPTYHLPQAILAAKSLTVLKLGGCRLDLPFTAGSTRFPSLQQLHLCSVHLDEQILDNLISTFPCVQIFALENFWELFYFRISGLGKLKMVELSSMHWNLKEVNIEAPSLETLDFCDELRSSICKVNLDACQNLKKLHLRHANLSDQLLQELISKLHLLETLNISYCDRLERVKILSHKLKSLSIYHCERIADVNIDSPNLCSFSFNGSKETTPSISLINNLISQLGVRVYFDLHRDKNCGAEWLLSFRQFLANFGRIEDLYLCLPPHKDSFIQQELPDVSVPPPSEVTSLKLLICATPRSLYYAALVNGLFWSCRPKTLKIWRVVDWHFGLIRWWNNQIDKMELILVLALLVHQYAHRFASMQFLLNKLKNREDVQCCNANAIKRWEDEVEDVKIRIKTEIEYEMPHWTDFLHAMPTTHYGKNVYFDFKWQQSSTC
ncbi:PREDICTED: uncharacterized protein LOC18596092 [Theobroma cacao]|uniref:Uncharacterized protein LOC18596092 n=1 Tax=Theobroma cacao TaxID=3641 RepID=A0AB32WK24_THECC|nr:PREDICTED: uncharacterized protein LOC18596092 [Theobroma cacao]